MQCRLLCLSLMGLVMSCRRRVESVCCIQQTVTASVHVNRGEGDKVPVKEERVGGGGR